MSFVFHRSVVNISCTKMLNIYSIIIFSLCVLSYVPGRKACDENSFDEPLNITLTRPDHSSTFENLCPAETEADINMLNKFSTTYSFVWRYCLFRKQFEAEENKLCRSKMKPIFSFYVDLKTKKEKKCGTEKKFVLHYFGYFYCGTMMEGLKNIRNMINYKLEMPNYYEQQKPDEISIYDVCYDKAKLETIYTSHRVLHPSIHQQSVVQEQPYCPNKISTEVFYMKLGSFYRIERYYHEEENKNPKNKYRMSPYPMVPPGHFLHRTWKKPTNHYINMAPLWEKLVPLMFIIDEAIKKAAIEIFRTSSGKQELRIFTKVENSAPKTKMFNIESFIKVSKNLFERKSHRFQPNIWHKFLYNEAQKEGIMIYIHNIPEEEPIIKKCSEDKTVKCDFHTLWSDSVNNSFESNSQIPILFKHAYCCQMTTKEVEEIFSRDFTIEKVLNLHSIITP